MGSTACGRLINEMIHLQLLHKRGRNRYGPKNQSASGVEDGRGGNGSDNRRLEPEIKSGGAVREKSEREPSCLHQQHILSPWKLTRHTVSELRQYGADVIM